ncbi:hypothetical protein B0H13DRAFT_669530 [Mycena leptocephala]|nr:hypothetical protein B0H13DRAFT_669530 [Mycena leptocephala]
MFNKALFAIFAMVLVQGVVSVPQIGFPVACEYKAGVQSVYIVTERTLERRHRGRRSNLYVESISSPLAVSQRSSQAQTARFAATSPVRVSATSANPCLLFAQLEGGTNGILMQAVGL